MTAKHQEPNSPSVRDNTRIGRLSGGLAGRRKRGFEGWRLRWDVDAARQAIASGRVGRGIALQKSDGEERGGLNARGAGVWSVECDV